VFRKSDKSKQKGGARIDFSKINFSQIDFSNTEEWYVPKMNEYDRNYSCMNSIHNILKNNQVIPRKITAEGLCRDLGIKMLDDNNVDIKYLTNRIVIENIIEDGKVEKVDGLNIFTIERDCNDSYDVELIKKGKKSDGDLAIILMKDGTLYNPVYHIEDNKRIGIFSMKSDIIKQLLEEI